MYNTDEYEREENLGKRGYKLLGLEVAVNSTFGLTLVSLVGTAASLGEIDNPYFPLWFFGGMALTLGSEITFLNLESRLERYQNETKE